MSKLFIIGNGFDLAHKLPTAYDCFHGYLKETYPDADGENSDVPWAAMGHHGEEVYDKDEVVGYLMQLLSRTAEENWSDFENALGRLDFSYDLFDPTDFTDRDGEPNYFHTSYSNEDTASQLAGCVPMILDLFSEWVKTIDLTKARPKAGFQRLIDPSHDLFLNFNYTQTLEKLYGIQNVCHIHGTLGETLLVGHGAAPLFDENHWSPYIGSESSLEFIQTVLRKDTAGALEKHRDFFQKLSSGLTAVYSYGFSFGEVDEVYIREICQTAPTEPMVWYLHNHIPSDHVRFRKILRKCGFQGKIDAFDCR